MLPFPGMLRTSGRRSLHFCDGCPFGECCALRAGGAGTLAKGLSLRGALRSSVNSLTRVRYDLITASRAHPKCVGLWATTLVLDESFYREMRSALIMQIASDLLFNFFYASRVYTTCRTCISKFTKARSAPGEAVFFATLLQVLSRLLHLTVSAVRAPGKNPIQNNSAIRAPHLSNLSNS